MQGHPGIFALGDVIDWDEQKQAAKGANHLAVVAPNVQSYLEGKPLKKVYKGSPEMILIPLGKVSATSPVLIVRCADGAYCRAAAPRTWAWPGASCWETGHRAL